MKMKKTLTIALLAIITIMALATGVNAATSSTLADELYAKGSKYGMTSADKVKIERYLKENPVTDAQANEILTKADEAIAVMEKAGVTNYDKLTKAQKNEVKSIATEAAKIVDLKLVFNKKSVASFFKAFTASSTSPYAVSMTTGSAGAISRIRFSQYNPSLPLLIPAEKFISRIITSIGEVFMIDMI